MLRKLKQRFRDIQTIRVLCIGAEKLANEEGHRHPGAEHFVLAALEMRDGTARRAFLQIGADPGLFRSAVSGQYEQALSDVGIHVPEIPPVKMSSETVLYEAATSGKTLMKKLTEIKKTDSDVPLLSAHVLVAALAAQFGTTPRALRILGIDRDRLAAAAMTEIMQVPRG